jgi:hypothetical protein
MPVRSCRKRLQQSNLGITNRELRGVHAHGDAACACGQVVSGQSALTAFVKPALGVQRQRMSWND